MNLSDGPPRACVMCTRLQRTPPARSAAYETFLPNTDWSRNGTVSRMTKYVTGNVLKRKNHASRSRRSESWITRNRLAD